MDLVRVGAFEDPGNGRSGRRIQAIAAYADGIAAHPHPARPETAPDVTNATTALSRVTTVQPTVNLGVGPG